MRTSLHLMAAGLVLLTHPGCKKEEPAPRADPGQARILGEFEAFPPEPGVVEFERRYTILVQGQPAGSLHAAVTRHETAGTIRRVVTNRQTIAFQRGAQRLEILSEDRSLEDERGCLLRFRHSERQGGGDEVITDAGKLGDEMVTVRGPEVIRVGFEPEALDPLLPHRWLFARAAPGTGDRRTFRTYTVQSAGYTSNHLEVVETRGRDATRTTVEQTLDSLPGVVLRLELESGWKPVAMETRMGALGIRYVQAGGDARDIGAEPAPDLTSLLSVPTDTRFDDRDAVRFARYRIEGLPGFVTREWLSGPGQKVVATPRPGSMIIEVTRVKPPPDLPFPSRPADASLRQYLESTAMAQADDPGIRSAARRATRGATRVWDAARRLRRWVTDEIDSDMGLAFASASEVLRKRKGDCTEQSVLLAALARAAGIPSRCVVGLVYQDGAFGRHAWTEVFVDDWYPLDAAQGTDQPSAAWIRIGEYSLKLTGDKQAGMGSILTLAAEMKISVERHEAD